MKKKTFIAVVATPILVYMGDAIYEALPINLIDSHIKFICNETVHGGFDWMGNEKQDKKYTRKCSKNTHIISTHYVAIDNNVYWMRKSTSKSSACSYGSVTSVFSNLNFTCLLSKRGQINSTEDRDLYFTAQSPTDFQSLENNDLDLKPWQREQLANYAKDAKSVYVDSTKIGNASPDGFSVIFPFGADEKWKRFEISKKADRTFLRSKSIGNVDLRQFLPFNPVICPEHGVHGCTAPRELNDFFKYSNWDKGVLGQLGKDIVFLQPYHFNRFPDMASPDMFMFATYHRIFVYTKEAFYELVDTDVYGRKKMAIRTKDDINEALANQ